MGHNGGRCPGHLCRQLGPGRHGCLHRQAPPAPKPFQVCQHCRHQPPFASVDLYMHIHCCSKMSGHVAGTIITAPLSRRFLLTADHCFRARHTTHRSPCFRPSCTCLLSTLPGCSCAALAWAHRFRMRTTVCRLPRRQSTPTALQMRLVRQQPCPLTCPRRACAWRCRPMHSCLCSAWQAAWASVPMHMQCRAQGK